MSTHPLLHICNGVYIYIYIRPMNESIQRNYPL